MQKHYINIGQKQYTVVLYDNGAVSISTTWESIVPSTVSSARPSYISRYASVDPNGRLGKKIMASLS